MPPSIPPMLPDWTMTTHDLIQVAKWGRRKVEKHEWKWAREYECRLFPNGMRYPRVGDLYEASEDMLIEFDIAWRINYPGKGEGMLQKGDQVIIQSVPNGKCPSEATALAVDYAQLQSRLVPEQQSSHPWYLGFFFTIGTVTLNQKFQLIHEESGRT